MSNEKKQEFTLKISQANKTQMIVILYEMTLAYMSDAKDAYAEKDHHNYRRALCHTRGCINELISSLNFEYDIAVNFLQLYIFITKELARAEIRMRIQHVENAEKIIREFLRAYRELCLQDNSRPLMENAEIVYSGLTYGRKQILDSLSHSTDRGFRV